MSLYLYCKYLQSTQRKTYIIMLFRVILNFRLLTGFLQNTEGYIIILILSSDVKHVPYILFSVFWATSVYVCWIIGHLEVTFLWCLVQHWNKYYYARSILICIFIVNTGGPRISWFQNSWSPLFRDSVSGLNFVNSLPFWGFWTQKKQPKFFRKMFLFSFVLILILQTEVLNFSYS